MYLHPPSWFKIYKMTLQLFSIDIGTYTMCLTVISKTLNMHAQHDRTLKKIQKHAKRLNVNKKNYMCFNKGLFHSILNRYSCDGWMVTLSLKVLSNIPHTHTHTRTRACMTVFNPSSREKIAITNSYKKIYMYTVTNNFS